MTPRGAHRSATIALSTVIAVIGVVLVVQALSGNGGVLSPRTLLGLLFLAAGVGRLYIATHRGRRA
jgi:hypothetical protein